MLEIVVCDDDIADLECAVTMMQKMRNNSDDSARALEKGDWKYAW